MHRKALSLSYYEIAIFEQLIIFIKGSFCKITGITDSLKILAIFEQLIIFIKGSFHEITGITDSLKRNAHDQNEQTIDMQYL